MTAFLTAIHAQVFPHPKEDSLQWGVKSPWSPYFFSRFFRIENRIPKKSFLFLSPKSLSGDSLPQQDEEGHGRERDAASIHSQEGKRGKTLKKIIRSASFSRGRSKSKASSSETSSLPPHTEYVYTDHYIDILDFYEKVAGRTYDNQVFQRKTDPMQSVTFSFSIDLAPSFRFLFFFSFLFLYFSIIILFSNFSKFPPFFIHSFIHFCEGGISWSRGTPFHSWNPGKKEEKHIEENPVTLKKKRHVRRRREKKVKKKKKEKRKKKKKRKVKK